MNLLQSTWLDILCLNLVYRSVPYSGRLVYADDFKCTEEDAIKFGSPLELDSVARRLARKLTDLNITREEYVFLKAMLLLNPGVYACIVYICTCVRVCVYILYFHLSSGRMTKKNAVLRSENHQILASNCENLHRSAIFLPLIWESASGLFVTSHEHFPTRIKRLHSVVSKRPFRAGYEL